MKLTAYTKRKTEKTNLTTTSTMDLFRVSRASLRFRRFVPRFKRGNDAAAAGSRPVVLHTGYFVVGPRLSSN